MVDTVEEFLGVAGFLLLVNLLLPIAVVVALLAAFYRLVLAVVKWDPTHLSDRYKM